MQLAEINVNYCSTDSKSSLIDLFDRMVLESTTHNTIAFCCRYSANSAWCLQKKVTGQVCEHSKQAACVH